MAQAEASKADANASQEEHSEQSLGPLLCWAVVFADIGTSIYYVPGILYGTVGKLAGFFVFLTMVVFVLLTFKYVEVTYRFPQGGGVVTVAAKALNRWFGALGGMFILVDYFLTSAISSLSGILYLSVVFTTIGPQTTFLGLSITVWITLLVLVLLGILNWIGISESAKVSLVGAIIAFASDVAILVTVFTHLSLAQFFALFPAMFAGGRPLTLVTILVGFAGSFLAFSGLESISQLSPNMKLPRRAVGKIALFLVVLTVGLTSPVLTVLSTVLLPKAAADPVLSSQLISLLGGHWGAVWLQTEVAISASALLVFASNTAIIGSYHVFMALARMEFFPAFLMKHNKLRNTPHYSIAFATLIPILVLVAVRGNINILGDMYAFGLLGAFTLTCVGMDIVRYRQRVIRKNKKAGTAPSIQKNQNDSEDQKLVNEEEEHPKGTGAVQNQAGPADAPETEGPWTRSTFNFYLGILTTVLVVIAWSTNLIAKPLATAFGGSVAIIGMIISYVIYNSHKKKGRVPVITTGIQEHLPGALLAILTADSAHNDEVIKTAVNYPEQKPVVFLFLGQTIAGQKGEIFKLSEPHVIDAHAKDIFGRANYQAIEAKKQVYFLYRPDTQDAVLRVWKTVRPAEIIVAADQEQTLKELPFQPVVDDKIDNGQVVRLSTDKAPKEQSA
jgi:amino acid transporter